MITNILIVGLKIAAGVAGAIAIGASAAGFAPFDVSDIGNHLDPHSMGLTDDNFHAGLHKVTTWALE